MKTVNAAFCALSLTFGVAPFAQAEWTSIWDSTKAKSYQVEGKIKSIAFNEQGREVLVKVESAKDTKDVQTVKVCSFDQSSDIRSVEQSEKMALLRQAFARGDSIQLSYNGPFDRCLSSIQY